MSISQMERINDWKLKLFDRRFDFHRVILLLVNPSHSGSFSIFQKPASRESMLDFQMDDFEHAVSMCKHHLVTEEFKERTEGEGNRRRIA